MSITQLEKDLLNQLTGYIETKDIISYCHTFPDELEETAKEDYQKGLITKEEFNYLLEKVANLKKKGK